MDAQFFLAFGFIVAFVLYLLVKRSRFSSRFAQLGNELGARRRSRQLTGTLGDVSYVVDYIPSGENSPPKLRIEVDAAAPADLEIVREGAAERLSKRTGLVFDLDTSDSEFNREFFVSGPDDRSARALLANALEESETRRAIREFFAIGFSRVYGIPGRLGVELDPLREEMLTLDLVRGAVWRLNSFARKLPDVGEQPAAGTVVSESERDVAASNKIVAFWLVVVLGTTVPYVLANHQYRPLDGSEIFWKAAAAGVLGELAIVLALVSRARGMSIPLRTFRRAAISAVLSIPFAGSLGVTGAITLNGVLDPGSSTTRVVEVRGKDWLRRWGAIDDSHASPVLYLSSWRDGREYEVLEVSEKTHATAKPGTSMIEITTRPGWLGCEWVESAELRAR